MGSDIYGVTEKEILAAEEMNQYNYEGKTVVGSIHTYFYDDPGIPPRVVIEGEVSPRQLVASKLFISKGHRTYMMKKRVAITKEVNDKATAEKEKANE